MKEGKILSGPEYVKLCTLRDEEKQNFSKLIYSIGISSRHKQKKLSIRNYGKNNKPGSYNNLDPDTIEYIMILSPDNTLKQTRWLECMVSVKEVGPRKMFIYFEPEFFSHIPEV